MMEKRVVAEMRKISKRFGKVQANREVDLTVYSGEIHAVLGENGCGKSTLMNILSGLYAPDGGEILLDGKRIVMSSPRDAIRKGIGMIHQHFKLVEAMTAWENIIGGTTSALFLSARRVTAAITELCEKYGLALDPAKRVSDMTIGEKQTVEIVKALYRGAEILILDEPTAVLTVQETERLFGILRRMREAGKAVIIITHKLNEVMELSDRVTVLRAGENVASVETGELSAKKLAELMVGREIDISVPFLRTDIKDKKDVLTIKELKIVTPEGRVRLGIPFLTIRSGEIVGVAGVSDSGQRELCEAITGLRKATSGSIVYQGRELLGLTPVAMAKEKIDIGYIPEDRLGMGLAGGLSIEENAILRTYRDERGLTVNRRTGRAYTERLLKDYDVSAAGSAQVIRSLSGGNIQKILLGREIGRGASLLIAAYPVRGLDIGATDYIYRKLNEEKARGAAILLIAEDLDTLLGISDRIAVLHAGKLTACVNAGNATKELLGMYMTGLIKEEAM